MLLHQALNGVESCSGVKIIKLHVQYLSELHPEPDKFKMDRFMDELGKFRKADSVMQFGIGRKL